MTKKLMPKWGYNRGNQCIYFDTARDQFQSENLAEVTINAKAARSSLRTEEVEIGAMMVCNSMTLLNDLEGRYLVKNTALETASKESK
ncbi:hypothetical protein [Pseudomonas sp. ANT_H12B]|uniref:hypothetical protein n=1 Tax=Pseudomonas sp. ANT_H12B TaxID=2597348 RepID=UPI0011EBDFD7|nr:hypothetical protein [Pseudomonas sp. ANT_H12B]KAA0978048.1 hypothetical protein FQ185_02835 [Pseudomonas sp. ANT_H12B]